MNTNILICKAKSIEEHTKGQWVEGTYVCTNLCGKHHVIRTPSEVAYYIDPDTLCQCTGIKERKEHSDDNKLIFVGDIVHTYGGEHWYGYWEQDSKTEVKSDFDNMYTNSFWLGECEYVEIIGNIHDK